MVPFLSGYLRLQSPTGECIEIFNSCRTKANFGKPGRAVQWELQTSGTWDDECGWLWNEEPYDDFNIDPWFDSFNPASEQVAGFLVDAPDDDGHGFYLEPAGSKRIVQASGFEPLEMFFTGAVVSSTQAGERTWLRWVDRVLRDCTAACEGWDAVVYTNNVCEEDYLGVELDENGDFVLPSKFPTGEPLRPFGDGCLVADVLEPDSGEPWVQPDTGLRRLSGLRYKGYEVLEEGLNNCSGNRYKFCFDVFSHDWARAAVKAAKFSLTEKDCVCFCTDLYVGVGCSHDNCGNGENETPNVNVEIEPPSSPVLSSDTAGGLISLPGRYSRPEKVNVKSALSPLIGGGDHAPVITLKNNGQKVENVRLTIWEAADGVAPPDTRDGWCFYRNLKPAYTRDIAHLEEGETWCFTEDGSCFYRCVDGSMHEGDSRVDKSCDLLTCEGRYWLTVEACCGQPNDLEVEWLLSRVETI